MQVYSKNTLLKYFIVRSSNLYCMTKKKNKSKCRIWYIFSMVGKKHIPNKSIKNVDTKKRHSSFPSKNFNKLLDLGR